MAMKKVLAFLLAILMIVPLAACNKTEEPEVTTEPAPVQTTAEQTEPATEPPVTDCVHTYTEVITEKPKALKDGSKTLTCSACGDSRTEAIPATKTLKVLAIGNSFSSDATEYLWNIAKDGGVEKIIIGNDQHVLLTKVSLCPVSFCSPKLNLPVIPCISSHPIFSF